MAALGVKHNEIAERLDISPAMVSYTLNSELGIREMERIQRQIEGQTIDVASRIQELSNRALDVLEDLIDEPNPADKKLQADVAKDLLSRAGYSPIKQIQTRGIVGVVTADVLQEAKDRIRYKQENSKPEEAQYAEVLDGDDVDAIDVDVG